LVFFKRFDTSPATNSVLPSPHFLSGKSRRWIWDGQHSARSHFSFRHRPCPILEVLKRALLCVAPLSLTSAILFFCNCGLPFFPWGSVWVGRRSLPFFLFPLYCHDCSIDILVGVVQRPLCSRSPSPLLSLLSSSENNSSRFSFSV